MVKMVPGSAIQHLLSVLWLDDRCHDLVRVCLATAGRHPRLCEADCDDRMRVQRVTSDPFTKVDAVVSRVGDLELVLDASVLEPEPELGLVTPPIVRNHDRRLI